MQKRVISFLLGTVVTVSTVLGGVSEVKALETVSTEEQIGETAFGYIHSYVIGTEDEDETEDLFEGSTKLLFDYRYNDKAVYRTYKVGEPFGELPKPVRKGYRFDGWYTAKSGGTKIKEDTINLFEDGTCFYAKWAKIKNLSTSFDKAKCSKKVITLSWKKIAGAQKYQLCLSNTKFFKPKRTEELKKNSVKIKGGRKGCKYFFKVRAVVKDSAGKKVCTKWSKVKSVSVK